ESDVNSSEDFVEDWNVSHPRAKAEPALERWAQNMLVKPKNVTIKIEYLDPETHSIIYAEELTLDMLKLCALDYIYMAEVSGESQKAELESRILYHLISSDTNRETSHTPTIKLNFQRDSS